MDEALFGNPLTSRVDELLKELWKTEGWPKDPEKDRALVAELLEQYPALDLADELFRFRGWLKDKGTGKEVKSRGRWSRVRNWCSRAGRAPARSTRAGNRRTSTAARPAEAFGSESSRSLGRW